MLDRRDVLVIGSHVYGIYVGCQSLPRAGETVSGHSFQGAVLEDGGKGSNQAMCAARLGALTSFVGAVGADFEGSQGMRLLALNGVDVSRVVKLEDRATGVSVAFVDETGVSMIVTVAGANAGFSFTHLSSLHDLFSSHRFCLVQFELQVPVAIEAARRAREFHARAIVTPGPMVSLHSGALQGVDILAPNETEAAHLLGVEDIGPDVTGAARRIHECWGVENVVLTLGDQGCAAFWEGKPFRVPAFEVAARNTIGAGDAFVAALATGLCRGLTIRDALILASAVAAMSVSNAGAPWASYPHARDVAQFLAQRGHQQLAHRAALS